MRVTLNIPSKFTPTLRTQQYATALWMSYNCNSYCSMWNIMVMLILFFDWGQKAARRALQVRERLMFLVKAAFAWFFSPQQFSQKPHSSQCLWCLTHAYYVQHSPIWLILKLGLVFLCFWKRNHLVYNNWEFQMCCIIVEFSAHGLCWYYQFIAQY